MPAPRQRQASAYCEDGPGRRAAFQAMAARLPAAGAAIIGRMIGYVIGREYGYWLLLRYGGYLWITQSRIKLGQYLFLRHGGKIILIAQFLPVLRSIAGIFAGASRMPWLRSFINGCSALWRRPMSIQRRIFFASISTEPRCTRVSGSTSIM